MPSVNTLLDMVNEADPKDLELSRKSCHSYGLDSIVLKSNDEALVRLFMAWPHHQLWQNTPESWIFSIGPHTAVYGLTLSGVIGEVTSYLFKEDTVGLQMEKYEYFPASTEGIRPLKSRMGKKYLSPDSTVTLKNYGAYYMSPERIRTYYVPRLKPAAWLVREGPLEGISCDLYSPNDVVNCPVVARIGSADSVKEVVGRFFRQAKRYLEL